MLKEMADDDGLKKSICKDDILVLDSDFREVRHNLEELGFRILMPASKGKWSFHLYKLWG